jgi:hypothetical protein
MTVRSLPGLADHEGSVERRLVDGSRTLRPVASFVALVPVCACGWVGPDLDPAAATPEVALDAWDDLHARLLLAEVVRR